MKESNMKKPASIQQVEIIIYACLAVSALVSLLNKWSGVIGSGEFAFNLVIYGLLCMIPYKIGRGSNPARYVYVISSVLGVLLMMGGGIKIPKVDLILSVIFIPVEIYVSWVLFQPEGTRWFTGLGDDSEKPSWAHLKERQEPK